MVGNGALPPIVGCEPPRWALGLRDPRGSIYCWGCDCRHKSRKTTCVIDYCAEQGLLKVGTHWILSPSANMRKFLLQKPKAEWPEVVRICNLSYQRFDLEAISSKTASPTEALATKTAEDTPDMSLDAEGATEREAGDPVIPHMPTDGNSDVVVVTGKVRAELLAQLSKEACNAADLDRMTVIVVNNPRPCGTTSKEKYRPSEEEVAGYRLLALPAAVFEKEGEKHNFRFVGLDNLCPPVEAEIFGRCFEKVAKDGARLTAPSRGHVPAVVHIHAKDGHKPETEQSAEHSCARKKLRSNREDGKSVLGANEKETKVERRPMMGAALILCSTNPERVKSGNYYSIPHRNKVPLYNICAICTAAVRRLRFAILLANFAPALCAMSTLLQEFITISMAGLPITSAAISINGWGNYAHLDKRDYGKFSFIVWFGIGDLSKVLGGTFVFPSWGLKLQLSHCTAIYLATSLVPHCTVPSTANEEGRYVGMALYANTQAVNAGHDFIVNSGTNFREAARKKGFYLVEEDIDVESKAMPEITAMLKLPVK